MIIDILRKNLTKKKMFKGTNIFKEAKQIWDSGNWFDLIQ